MYEYIVPLGMPSSCLSLSVSVFFLVRHALFLLLLPLPAPPLCLYSILSKEWVMFATGGTFPGFRTLVPPCPLDWFLLALCLNIWSPLCVFVGIPPFWFILLCVVSFLQHILFCPSPMIAQCSSLFFHQVSCCFLQVSLRTLGEVLRQRGDASFFLCLIWVLLEATLNQASPFDVVCVCAKSGCETSSLENCTVPWSWTVVCSI